MDHFNLKKKESRKKLYFKKNNILHELGKELLNSKLNLIKINPNSIIQFGEEFNIKNFCKKKYLLKNFDELFENQKVSEVFLSNFELQIYLACKNNLFKYIYDSLNDTGLVCFNLITNNSLVTLKKIFYQIDEVLYKGSYRRFGPFHDTQSVIEDLNKNNFKETVVSTENIELNYNSLKKMRKEFKEFGISNYYKDKTKFNKDFYLKTKNIFEQIIKKNSYFPVEIEIATFTTWKY